MVRHGPSVVPRWAGWRWVGASGTTSSCHWLDQLRRARRRSTACCATAILDGSYAAGRALPSERALSEELGASRHAVREALKRLQQAGLVSISQGGSTRVRDWRRHGGLDLMLALGAEGELPPEGLGLVRSLFEMRASIGADAARLAALRADAAARAELEARAAALAAADDPAARTAIYDVLWDRIIDAADNLAYRLALNTLVAGQRVLSFDATHRRRRDRRRARGLRAGPRDRRRRRRRRLRGGRASCCARSIPEAATP